MIDFDWAAKHFLSPPALEEYERVTAAAWADYERAAAAVFAEYERAMASAFARGILS